MAFNIFFLKEPLFLFQRLERYLEYLDLRKRLRKNFLRPNLLNLILFFLFKIYYNFLLRKRLKRINRDYGEKNLLYSYAARFLFNYSYLLCV